MTAPSAWTVSAAVAAAQAALSRLEANGDVDTDEAAALAVLREEAPDIDLVLARLLRAMGEADANRDAIHARIETLEVRLGRFVRQRDEYRRTVFAILDALGVRKWKNAEFSVSIADGRPGVVITDEAALPNQCFTVTRTPNKTKIKELLEAGAPIGGAVLANALTLTVRTK